ncbi:glycosyltransferase family 2 protein [Bacteroides fragilis]
MCDVPLVSVCVITYNSSIFILETLESIKEQTYKNIELVISDDCSTDNTVDICRKWVQKYRMHFANVIIVTSDYNTGISANCNRCYKAANAEWIKGIAGDDLLVPNCIEDFVRFVETNRDIKIVSSMIDVFGDDIRNYDWYNKWYDFLDTKPNGCLQYKALLTMNYIPAVSVFMRKSLWECIGGFDESIKLLEDWPMWLKITGKGIPFYFLRKRLTIYRCHNGSIQMSDRIKLAILLCKFKYIYKVHNVPYLYSLHQIEKILFGNFF